MIRLSEIKLSLSDAENPATPLQAAAAGILHLTPADILRVAVFKRSFDARKADLMAVYIIDVEVAPTLATACAALPPEGAELARERPFAASNNPGDSSGTTMRLSTGRRQTPKLFMLAKHSGSRAAHSLQSYASA